jgi:hypothetical protein
MGVNCRAVRSLSMHFAKITLDGAVGVLQAQGEYDVPKVIHLRGLAAGRPLGSSRA